MIIQQVWDDFLKIMNDEVGSRVVETWFKTVVLKRWDPIRKEVYLEAPNRFVKDWIAKQYSPLCKTHLARLLHVPEISVIVTDQHASQAPAYMESIAVNPVMPAVTTYNEPNSSAIATFVAARKIQSLKEQYTFDTFVVGPNNSLAYAAAQAVAEQPGVLYNPLFVYGASGLGKTHLLHAIGNSIRDSKKAKVIMYQAAERFVSEFINAIRFNKMHQFERKYQEVDVLLIDDIQCISNKDQTQEAFFYIFNVLYDAHKQLVFSSDTYPQHIDGIAERLRSRLSWGLVVDMYAPSIETRIAILKKKAQASNVLLNDEVALAIAAMSFSNIRELEGALVRVVAFASITQQPLTATLVQSILVPTAPVKEQSGEVDPEAIFASLINFFPYSKAELLSASRNKDVVAARHVAIYLLKRFTDKSLRDIGMYLGSRDHSTVLHAIEKIRSQMEKDATFSTLVHTIERDIQHRSSM